MQSARRIGNCLTFALGMWWATRGRGWIGFHRSDGLKGKVPHFVHGRLKRRGTELLIVEAIPPRRKGAVWERGDMFFAFPMIVRASRWKRVAMGTGDSVREAMRQMWRRDVCKHCGRMP